MIPRFWWGKAEKNERQEKENKQQIPSEESINTSKKKSFSFWIEETEGMPLIALEERVDEYANGNIIKTETAMNKYSLQEVSKAELLKCRLSKKPGFVYKNSGRLYYTEIPEGVKFNKYNRSHCSKKEGHQCIQGAKLCKCFQNFTGDDGCRKVSDLPRDVHLREGKDWAEAVCFGSRIERYSFIARGYETFNTPNCDEVFIVLRCSNCRYH